MNSTAISINCNDFHKLQYKLCEKIIHVVLHCAKVERHCRTINIFCYSMKHHGEAVKTQPPWPLVHASPRLFPLCFFLLQVLQLFIGSLLWSSVLSGLFYSSFGSWVLFSEACCPGLHNRQFLSVIFCWSHAKSTLTSIGEDMGYSGLHNPIYFLHGGIPLLVWTPCSTKVLSWNSWGFSTLTFLWKGRFQAFTIHCRHLWFLVQSFYELNCIFHIYSRLLALYFLLPCIQACCFRLTRQFVPNLEIYQSIPKCYLL